MPTDCWRNGSKIYLDCTCKKPLYTFKVKDKEINITKDNSNYFSNYEQLKMNVLVEGYKEKLNTLEKLSIDKMVDYIINNTNSFYVVSHSGGKDSTLTYHLWTKALDVIKSQHKDIYDNLKWEINFSNTSNDTAETYRYIKQELPQEKLHILNPKIGFFNWIKNVKNYFTPSTMVRNCCSTYKEGQVNKYYDKNKDITMVTGVRKYESTKRAKYDYIMDYDFRIKIHGNSNLPKTWVNFAPIVEWHDEEVWLYLIREGLKYNKQYDLGFNRCGCLICPYQSDYIDLLIEEHYPKRWQRWMSILEKNHEIYGIGNSLKWTLEEWKNGKWKHGTSKEYEIINSKPTKERIRELAELKGISDNMAEKYFNKKCKCGKKMNPHELAMFYKTFGRFENVEDERDLLCKKCFCELQGINKKEYTNLVIQYLNEGCNLF